ncbi:Acyl-CoA [Hortaea werneckii]|nr:Acyl-CoA [Hortaea werneckii]
MHDDQPFSPALACNHTAKVSHYADLDVPPLSANFNDLSARRLGSWAFRIGKFARCEREKIWRYYTYYDIQHREIVCMQSQLIMGTRPQRPWHKKETNLQQSRPLLALWRGQRNCVYELGAHKGENSHPSRVCSRLRSHAHLIRYKRAKGKQSNKSINVWQASLCRTSARRRVIDLSDLLASPDDPLTVLVFDDHGALAVIVGALPDLDFHAAADYTDTHGGEQVVGGVGVVVDAAVEHGGRVLADPALDHGLATGVVGDEVGHVVDDTGNRDQATAVLALVNVVIPLEDGQLLKRHTPVELGALLVELLLLLLETALLDLVGTELLQVVREAELLPGPDRPLGWVVLVPLDRVAVVRRELVVEVVVALSERDESGDDVVTRAVAVVEWLVAKPVCEGVHTEGCLLDEEDAEDTGVDEAAHPVTPAETADQAWEDQAHEEDDLEVVLVLPDDNGIVVQVRDVGTANSLRVLLHDHPPEVRVEQTLPDAVWVLVGVGVAVVRTVVASPPSDGTLNGTATNSSQVDLERERSRVRSVSPQPVVAGGDTEAGSEVVRNCPDSGLPPQRRPRGGDETSDGNADNEDDIEPVDMLVPVFLGQRRLGDVWLLRVIVLVPDRLLWCWLGLSTGDVRQLGWVDSRHAGRRLMRRHRVVD